MPSRAELLAMSRELGRPELDLVILGEGNTAAIADESTFWVKASGTQLASLGEGDLVRCSFDKILAMLDARELSDAEVRTRLATARVDPAAERQPSVETLMHALCLRLPDVRFVGHTHPIALEQILCSNAFPGAFMGRLFPDEIVICGKAPVLVPYVDPGVPLARAIAERVRAFMQEHGERPRVILLQNHGLVALGASAKQVLDITAMVVKAARILHGALACGGPRFLSPEHVERIEARPDEHYRRRMLGAG